MRTAFPVICLFVVPFLIACGGDDGASTSQTSATTGGAGGASGSGGTSGTAGIAGASGKAGAGGAGAAGTAGAGGTAGAAGTAGTAGKAGGAGSGGATATIEGSYDLAFTSVTQAKMPLGASSPSKSKNVRLDVRAIPGGYEALFTPRYGTPAAMAAVVDATSVVLTGDATISGSSGGGNVTAGGRS